MQGINSHYQPNWHELQAVDGASSELDNLQAMRALQAVSGPVFPSERSKEMVLSTYTSLVELVMTENNSNTTFTLFPEFPTEIRRIIWRKSLPGARIVEVFWDEETGICRSPCPLPVALSVNQESREVALEQYQLCFETPNSPARIYFDPKFDELYLGVGNIVAEPREGWSGPLDAFFEAISTEEQVKIANIAIDEDIVRDPDAYDSSSYGEEAAAYDVESLTVIKSGGVSDFVLELVNRNPVEYDVWQFDEHGKTVPWDEQDVNEGEELTWCNEQDFKSEAHEKTFTEGNAFRTISRFVNQDRLVMEPRWTKRMEFLLSCVLWENGCLYLKDGVIEKLVEMETKDPGKYRELAHMCTGKCEFMVDPLLVYTIQTPCSCAIGHKHTGSPLGDWFPDVSKIDLRGNIKMVYWYAPRAARAA